MSGDAVRILLTLATIGVVIGTLTEWLFGRTPGKLITDCEVVAIVSGAETTQNKGDVARPSLASCLIRNCVKWFLSPVAMLALFDDSGRHRGDQIARAAVVVEIRDEDDIDDAE
jgi:membrane protein YqaA with SNARE-associated domain